MKFVIIVLISLSSNLYSQSVNDIILNSSGSNILDIKNRFGFSYGITYLGPSLDNDRQEGSTYNRFKTEEDSLGNITSGIASYQTFHFTSIRFKASKNVTLSYSYTFQDDLNEGIQYEYKNFDGSTSTFTRGSGFSNNNQRINAFVTNLYSNNFFFLTSNFFYELPTTDTSINDEMTYGLGFEPNIGIYMPIAGMFSGISASIQRNYFKQQEFKSRCGQFYCDTIRRTLMASISPYIGYNITDKITLRAAAIFDWDQKGDNVDENNLTISAKQLSLDGVFTSNMEDVANIGFNYRLTNMINVGANIETVIADPVPEKTVLIGNFSMNI